MTRSIGTTRLQKTFVEILRRRGLLAIVLAALSCEGMTLAQTPAAGGVALLPSAAAATANLTPSGAAEGPAANRMPPAAVAALPASPVPAAAPGPVFVQGPAPVPALLASRRPVATVYLRERGEVTDWFGAPPAAEQYALGDSLLRISLAQRLPRFDYLFEMSNATELDLPRDAVSSVAAQGQLGLGGTYYAANGGNVLPVAISFKSGFVRMHFQHDAGAARLGRFEFFEGQEMAPKNTALAWLQANRVAQRLIGNFGFANAQRSFDGVDAKAGGANWDVTAMAGRPTHGVFNMNSNKELDVDIQYLAASRLVAKQRVLLRGFAIGYHDGRPNITKTDNRPLAVRAADHGNIRIGTFGGDMIAALPVHGQTLDLMAWGAGQNGQWGALSHRAGAIAAEGGLRLDGVASTPWLRGGYLRTTGDNNATDGTHNTFFQLLPTPRVYARFPYFNMMNSTDAFVQLIDRPGRRLEMRADLHWLKLTAPADLWYSGGGAFDSNVFGFTGRPANGHSSFSTLADVSADYALSRQLSLSAYYAHAYGKTVVAAIFPLDRNANFGFIELNYKLSKALKR